MSKNTDKAFGSFHNESVEYLVRIPDAEYAAPELPFPAYRFDGAAIRAQGAQERKRDLWLLDDSWTFLNHGAFGATLRASVDAVQHWMRRLESQPLRFVDRELLCHRVHVLRRFAATWLGASPTDVVLLSNVTTALNSALRTLRLRQGDHVLAFDITYGATKKIIRHLSEITGCDASVSELTLQNEGEWTADCSDPEADSMREALIDQCVDALASLPTGEDGRKVVILDYVTSNTAIVLPVREVIAKCRAQDPSIVVIVDAAHALGADRIDDVPDWGADFVTGNCHKWFCGYKGSAFMWVHPRHQEQIDPLAVSHGMGSGFTSAFVWNGLCDYGPTLSLLTVMDFWEAVGADFIRSSNHELLVAAVQMLVRRWGSGTLVPLQLYQSMATVRLCGPHMAQSENEHNELQDALYERYKIEAPIKRIHQALYVRISCHLYNSIEEYAVLADAMLDLRPSVEVKG